jgi:hypothetical protein
MRILHRLTSIITGLLLLQLTLATSISACVAFGTGVEEVAAEHAGMTMASTSSERTVPAQLAAEASVQQPDDRSCGAASGESSCPTPTGEGSCFAVATCGPTVLAPAVASTDVSPSRTALAITSPSSRPTTRTTLPELPPPRA